MDRGTGNGVEPDQKNGQILDDEREFDTIPASAADVESAGRSCLAILLLVAIIVIVAGIWLVFWSST